MKKLPHEMSEYYENLASDHIKLLFKLLETEVDANSPFYHCSKFNELNKSWHANGFDLLADSHKQVITDFTKDIIRNVVFQIELSKLSETSDKENLN